MAVMFTAMFSAASLVWDREFGFLREMMVAPVRRSSLVLGKCLGGATVAGFQGVIVIALAPLVGVPYNARPDPRAVRAAAAARVRDHRLRRDGRRADQPDAVVHGADADGDHADVLPLRRAVLGRRACRSGWRSSTASTRSPTRSIRCAARSSRTCDISAAARHALDPGVTWWGWHVPSLARGRGRRAARAGDAVDRDRGVQPRGVSAPPRRGDAVGAALGRSPRPRLRAADPGLRPRRLAGLGSARRMPSASVRGVALDARRSMSGCSDAAQERASARPSAAPRRARSAVRCRARSRRSPCESGAGLRRKRGQLSRSSACAEGCAKPARTRSVSMKPK